MHWSPPGYRKEYLFGWQVVKLHSHVSLGPVGHGSKIRAQSVGKFERKSGPKVLKFRSGGKLKHLRRWGEGLLGAESIQAQAVVSGGQQTWSNMVQYWWLSIIRLWWFSTCSWEKTWCIDMYSSQRVFHSTNLIVSGAWLLADGLIVLILMATLANAGNPGFCQLSVC